MTDPISSRPAPRRSVFLRIGAAAIAAGCISALAGCGGGTASGASDSSNSSTTSLSIGYNADPAPQGYDPLLYSAGQRLFFESLYQSLFAQLPNGGVAPELVQSFSYNASKTQMTLILKPGVKFTDGSTLTAQLVKANLDRRSNSKLTSYGAFAAGGAAEIKNVAAPSASTVVLTFGSPQANFQTELAGEPGMIVGQKAIASPASLGTTPDGSGPYTLSSSGTTSGSSYTLDRKASTAKATYPYGTLVYKVFTQAQSLANAAVSGQVEVGLIDPSVASMVEASNTAVVKNGGTVLTILVFDKEGKTSKPFGNTDVRLALNYALNRSAFVAALHKGSHPTANAFPQKSAGYDPALDAKYAYNPAKAKQLLAAAGYPHGFSFSLVISPDQQTDLQVFQQQWQAVGVNMHLTVTTSTAKLFAAVTSQPLGYTPLAWANEVGVTAGVLVGGFANLQKATDPVILKALGAASNAQGAAQAPALKALNNALVNEGWVIPVAEEYYYVSYNKAKVTRPVFPGLDNTPLLISLRPVS
jgi:peptide/nickel transport system substrate-binding protein